MHFPGVVVWLSLLLDTIISGSSATATYDFHIPNTHLLLRMTKRRDKSILLPNYRRLMLQVRGRIHVEAQRAGRLEAPIYHNIEQRYNGLNFEFNNAGELPRVRPTYKDAQITIDGLDRGIVQLKFYEMDYILFILSPEYRVSASLATGRLFDTNLLTLKNATRVLRQGADSQSKSSYSLETA